MGIRPYLIFLKSENIMKKITTIIALSLITLGLVSCRGYNMTDGRYDYYNDTNKNTVRDMVDNGVKKAERGINKGFNKAERGFDAVTGMNNR